MFTGSTYALAPSNPPMADTFYDRIETFIKEAEGELKQDEQLEITCSSPSGEVILITDIGYHNPYLIMLYGQDKHMNQCTILTHMDSVQLMIKTISLEDAGKHRHIGFLADRS
jgi:hypothetical protein